MKNEISCVKIKDGLYFGNAKAAQVNHTLFEDAEFLFTNKFTHIINCASEIGNYYEQHGIKYLKFKFVKKKEHCLWDENLVKLIKIHKFVENSEDNSMCCLIHSHHGTNRGIAILIGYLMMRFQWKLSKTLEFVKSKSIFIALSEHYIGELERLERILEEKYDNLSENWLIDYKSGEEEIISKTYLNTQEIEYKRIGIKEKQEKTVTWKDITENKKKLLQREVVIEQQKERGIKVFEEEKNVLVLQEKLNKNENDFEIQITHKKNSKENAFFHKKKTKSEQIKEKEIASHKKLNPNAKNRNSEHISEVDIENGRHQGQSKHEAESSYLEIIKEETMNEQKKKKRNIAQNLTIEIGQFEEKRIAKPKANANKLSIALKKDEKRQVSKVKKSVYL